jgi:hypothetical protein
MKEKAFQKATEYIDAIAAKLGVAAEHVYGILVRQQYVEGITTILGCLTFVAVMFFISRKITDLTKSTRESAKKKSFTEISEDLAHVVLVLGWIAFFFALIFASFAIPDSVAKLINPEYYAIKEILDAIGGK